LLHLPETHETTEYIDSIERPLFSTLSRFGLSEFKSPRPDHLSRQKQKGMAEAVRDFADA
jgi:hypothetical protein